MAVKYTLPASVIRKIEGFKEAKEELAEFIADQRCARGDMSERWQESAKYEAHETWTDGLEELEAELGELVDTLELLGIPEFTNF